MMQKRDAYGVSVYPEGNDRFLTVALSGWSDQWRIQFPEGVTAHEGMVMACPTNCCPEWGPLDDGWGYTWRTTEAYAAEVREMHFLDAEGNPQHERFFIGLALRAEARRRDDGLELSLTLTNESANTVHDVWCDGGCWQARSEMFMDHDEAARSYVMVGGRMLSMHDLAREKAIRCRYRCDLSMYDERGDYFWGRSPVVIDAPAIVGAVSCNGAKALVLGYAGAVEASQNGDNHHCLHSSPGFGDIAPGESVTRTGYVLFGSDIQALGEALAARLSGSAPAAREISAGGNTNKGDGYEQ